MKTHNMLAVVGQTGAGKSALAHQMALKYDGEIICADSRTVYVGMDIGTAKPTWQERSEVPYHCLDLVEPSQRFSVAEFQTAARQAMSEIRIRGRLPIIVGGSGLYIDSVLYDYDLSLDDNDKRAELEILPLDALQELARERGLTPPPDTWRNPRHLVGFIARGGEGRRAELDSGICLVGIKIEPQVLEERIAQRVDAMLAAGFVEEVASLMEHYGSDAPGLLAPGYQPFMQYVAGDIELEEAKRQFITNDKQLARRQKTWFLRNKDIHWVASFSEAEHVFLNNS